MSKTQSGTECPSFTWPSQFAQVDLTWGELQAAANREVGAYKDCPGSPHLPPLTPLQSLDCTSIPSHTVLSHTPSSLLSQPVASAYPGHLLSDLPSRRAPCDPLPLSLLPDVTSDVPAPSQSGPPPTMGRVSRKKWKHLKQRRKKATAPPSRYKVQQSLLKRFCTSSDAAKVGSSTTTFLRAHDRVEYRCAVENRVLSLDELKEEGINVLEWDGSKPLAIIDKDGFVFAVFVGHPTGDPPWEPNFSSVGVAMDAARRQMSLKPESSHRGYGTSIDIGYSSSGRREQPMNIVHSSCMQGTLEGLCQLPALQRLVGFSRSTFAFYMPKLYMRYAICVESVEEHDPSLRRPFRNSPFPAASFNFGPSATRLQHADENNLADSISAVYAGGHFDYRKGGHLVLRSLGIAVEFPPASLALIPSVMIRHGSVSIQEGEDRWTFAQYATGHLFRYQSSRFQTPAELADEDPQLLAVAQVEVVMRSNGGAHHFSRASELQKDHQDVFGL
ncbi:hypothetical protein CERSUDRAFT_119080 [Gelatoporia subvermispora B]|uniref:Uncharacterized protein n=1 Tax=Ceriporiopsis subvermispora (strain B) TaxID=914234 RepID=M2P9I0_CERS8|nr:hypothetical protein CERSUDRAFT_119080 [Gelatoporia subvermispora B]